MAADLIIRNVTVVDGTGAEAAPGVDVVIRNGRFSSVGPGAGNGQTAPSAAVLDGAGRYLVPGLWEGHTHLRHVLKPTEEESQVALDAALSDYLQRGITSVVDLGGRIAPYNRLRQRHQTAGRGGCARLLFAGANFTGVGGWPLCYHHDTASTFEVRDAASGVAALRSQLERSPDVIKLMYDGRPGAETKLPRAALEALIQEAHAHGRNVLVHVYSAADSLAALEAGADGLEHSFMPTPGQQQAEAEQVTEALVRRGAYLTPTLAAWEQIGRAGDAAYVAELVADEQLFAAEGEALLDPARGWGNIDFPHHSKAECLARLEAALAILPAMHAAGVKLVAGADVALAVQRPEAAIRELVLLARAGMPPKDVLVAATRHAAEKLGLGATVGTIAPGKIADALLLDADPLADLANLLGREHRVATIKDGVAYPRTS